MKFFFRCVANCRLIVLDHVTSKAQTGRLDKASHMSGIVTRRRLFMKPAVRRRPRLPVWSVHFTKQTKPWAILDWWALMLSWVLKEDFPFQLEG